MTSAERPDRVDWLEDAHAVIAEWDKTRPAVLLFHEANNLAELIAEALQRAYERGAELGAQRSPE